MFVAFVFAALGILVGSAQEQDGRVGLVGDDGKFVISIPAHNGGK